MCASIEYGYLISLGWESLLVERLQPSSSSLTGGLSFLHTPYRSNIGLFDTRLIFTRALALPCYCARVLSSLNILLLSSWPLRDLRATFPFRRMSALVCV